MTNEQAHKILHPSTSKEAIFEIQSHVGFDKEKGIKIVEEACLVACEAIEKQIPKKPIVIDFTNLPACPNCKQLFDADEEYYLENGEWRYCGKCGQKMDWSD